MTDSQNGYWANNINITNVFEIPKCNRYIRLRMGAPGLVLIHFATWFDRNIEPLDQGKFDEWGYAERNIIGSEAVSNHASGTAMDLNATKHPLGQRNTFSNAQEKAIRTRLKHYNGCIRWGGDYENRADEMHFELNRGLSAVQDLWHNKLRDTPIGEEVRRAQHG